MSDNQKIIDKLNVMLHQEHACAIRYATHAATITGPASESIRARLKEISADEVEHAEILRDRIIALGGEPSMGISIEDLKPATNLQDILRINIEEEEIAIVTYSEILKHIPHDNAILYHAIWDIIRDEQEHLEELQNLL